MLLFAEPCRRGGCEWPWVSALPLFISGVRVAGESFRRRLECLGWKPLAGGQQPDGRWWQAAKSCGHTVVALARNRQEAWSAASSMALNVTRDGHSSLASNGGTVRPNEGRFLDIVAAMAKEHEKATAGTRPSPDTTVRGTADSYCSRAGCLSLKPLG